MAGVIRHAKKQKNTVNNKEKNESIKSDTTRPAEGRVG